MPEGSKTHMGGTMRLGSRKTLLHSVDCITAKLYQVRAATSSYSCRQILLASSVKCS